MIDDKTKLLSQKETRNQKRKREEIKSTPKQMPRLSPTKQHKTKANSQSFSKVSREDSQQNTENQSKLINNLQTQISTEVQQTDMVLENKNNSSTSEEKMEKGEIHDIISSSSQSLNHLNCLREQSYSSAYFQQHGIDRKNDFDKFQALVFKEKHNEVTQKEVRQQTQFRKVLIICTGGTIGMFPTENGLAVKKGFFEKFLRENSYFCDSDYTFFHATDDFLITPLTIYNQRIWYKLYELDNPIDSTNMNTEYYDLIASIIEDNYPNYDAFVILHGTDTMAYTASALSFMLENLSKTVILTGSQIPCSSMRNDGFNNLLCSLTVAGHYNIPEVLVCFNDKLLRGNRCTKMDSSAMNSFDSPNYEPIATFKISIKIKWEKVLKRDPQLKFSVHKHLCDKIAIVKMHPFIASDTLNAILTNTDTRAVIIQTYGAGNIPTNRPELIQMLQKAQESGKVIVNLSQCYKSNVMSIYETGKALLKVGVLCGWDCTVEAMASKLAYLLSKNLSVDKIRKMVQQNLRGELSPPIENDMFEFQQEHFIQALNDALQYKTNEKIDILRSLILPNVVCYMSKGGFYKGMEQLKSYGIDFEKGDYDNRIGLHLAAREGQLDCVKYLIKQSKNVNVVDKFGRTPLFEAIINKHKDVVIELQRAGGVIEAPQSQVTSLLMQAVKEGDQTLLDLFLLGGLVDWNRFTTIDQRNLGHVATSFRKIEIIRFLKHQCKFKFNDKDRWGRTALDEAKKRDFKEICKIIS